MTPPTTPTGYLVALDESSFAAHVLDAICGLGSALGGPPVGLMNPRPAAGRSPS